MKAGKQKINYVMEAEVKYKGRSKKAPKVESPEAVYRFLLPSIIHCTQEKFIVLCVDNKNEVQGWSVVSSGTISETIVHPREVFKVAVMTLASSIIIAHNHPSGNLTPSHEDIEATKRIKEAGKILGITLLDHLILTDTGYYSMKEAGVI